MQTQPSTPTPPVAPARNAGRFLSSGAKPRLRQPALSAEDKAALLPQLTALRAKHAPRVLELAGVAIQAFRSLDTLEETVHDEACALFPQYVRDLQDYRLIFQHEYPERAEEFDDAVPFLEQAMLIMEAIETEGAGGVPPSSAVVDA